MATTTTTGATATYGDCVSALRSSLSYLESSVSTLANGVSDFPRLGGVLKSVRHYELIPQPSLAAAEASLRDEIGPAITTLLDRSEAHVSRLDRRIDSLKARAELQQGRLESDDLASESSGGKAGGSSSRRRDRSKERRLEGSSRLRARVVHQKKEALKYSVERLELEVLQKERELRKRLESTTGAA